MRRLLAALVLITACSTEAAVTTTTAVPSTTTTPPAPSTTTTSPRAAAYLVKLDPATLEEVPGLEPIPIGHNTWTITSDDGSLMVALDSDEETVITKGKIIDVGQWELTGVSFELVDSWDMALDERTLFAYRRDGNLMATDLLTGSQRVAAIWSPRLWLWDGLHVLPGGRIGGLGAQDTQKPAPDFSLLIHDPATGVTDEHLVGPLQRFNGDTGVFDGDYEIPEQDTLGVAWSEHRLFVADMDGPEITEVHLDTGAVQTHVIEVTSWWDRVLALWMPVATAKGPSFGTYTSAALSSDGRYLFISGNRYRPAVSADGSLAEENEHLGLVVVDTQTWRAIDSPDLPIQFVHAARGLVIGVDTKSVQPWEDHQYVLAVEDGQVSARPIPVMKGGCGPGADLRYLYCYQSAGTRTTVSVVDINTLEIVAQRTIGERDAIQPNGVLEDHFLSIDP